MNRVEETRTGRGWVADDGIVMVVQYEGFEHSLEDAHANVAAALRLADGRKRAMMVDLTGVKAMTREARARYAQLDSAETAYALAMVVGSPLSRMIGNFFLGFNRAPVPTRLFATQAEALAWLREKMPRRSQA